MRQRIHCDGNRTFFFYLRLEEAKARRPAARNRFEAIAASPTRGLDVGAARRVHDALRRLQRAGQRMAIVLSRDRTEIGIVAVKDILRVMFGEMKL